MTCTMVLIRRGYGATLSGAREGRRAARHLNETYEARGEAQTKFFGGSYPRHFKTGLPPCRWQNILNTLCHKGFGRRLFKKESLLYCIQYRYELPPLTGDKLRHLLFSLHRRQWLYLYPKEKGLVDECRRGFL